jgi:uncharacterized protein YjbI with pentapeptide repeats/class 3 adenylate cyclase
MDKQQLLDLIKKGVPSWNSWKKQSKAPINLDGVELSRLVLDRIDFSKVSLRGARLHGCRFVGADFTSANLEGASIQENNFTDAKLIAANLTKADLSGSVLRGANLLAVITNQTHLENIDFTGHDLSGFMLRGISLAGSNLQNQQLARVDLSNSNLQDVNFAGADLCCCLLNGANLQGARMQGARLLGITARNANFSGLDLSGMDLTRADFSGSNLTDCDFRAANLSKTNFAGADITGAKLWKLATAGWNIDGVQCHYAYWDRAGKDKTPYRKHEFERMFGDAITIELRYPYRLADHELATLPIFIEHLAAVHWGTILRLKSINDVAGGALVQFVVEEMGSHNPSQLKKDLQDEAERIQLAQLVLRSNTQLHLQLKEKIADIREEFWPRLLELAADHEKDQVRNLTVLFMDLKGFSKWSNEELSEKLSLFRGLVKPILTKWGATHPNMEGDSLRVTFRNATAGLSCACMIRGVLMAAGFELRIGMEMGEVLVVHNEVTDVDDLEGVAVSMAARLEAAAEPGEVLVSHRVRHYTERSRRFNFIPRQVPLKKGIGTKSPGDSVDCFAVEMLGNPMP